MRKVFLSRCLRVSAEVWKGVIMPGHGGALAAFRAGQGHLRRLCMLQHATRALGRYGSVHARNMSASQASQEHAEHGVVPFNLADIGEGIAEVEVLRWFIKEGDHVKAWDKICEVQSDKATVEITSRYDGQVVKIYHETGGIALVGKPLIDIRKEQTGDVPAAFKTLMQSPSMENFPPKLSTPPGKDMKENETQRPDVSVKQQGSAASTQVYAHAKQAPTTHFLDSSGKPIATPAVRHMAREHGVDLFNLRGTGRDGRVMKQDIEAYLETNGKMQSSSPAMHHAQTKHATRPPTPASPPFSQDAASQQKERVEPVRGYMRTMIKTMQSQAQIPHMGLSDEYEVDAAVELRQAIRAAAEAKGVKLSHLPIIIKAVSHALLEFPEINARLSADLGSVIYPSSHNIGIAVETLTGLVVPNIKSCESLSILHIAKEMSRLVDLAKAQKLSAADLSGGNFTISNIGAIGGSYAAPILMPNESVIVALGAIQKLPRYNSEGALVSRMIMPVSYSGDHRLLQGSQLARFSNRVKAIMNDPRIMLMEMR